MSLPIVHLTAVRRRTGAVGKWPRTTRPADRGNTYIREDLKLCTTRFTSGQARLQHNVNDGLPLCAPLNGSLWWYTHAPTARCGRYYTVCHGKAVWYAPLLFNNRWKKQKENKTNPTRWRDAPSYFHMLHVAFDLWNDMSSFIIHNAGGIIIIWPSRLATDSVNIMKSTVRPGRRHRCRCEKWSQLTS